MKKALIFLGAIVAAHATDCVISDTLTNFDGTLFSGRVEITLNNPASSQPLYTGSTTLTGWRRTVTVAAGAFAVTLVCTDSITPSGTSYNARFVPTQGTPWAETWTPATGTTTVRAMRATTVPTPTVTVQPGQIALASGRLLYGTSTGVAGTLAPGANGYFLSLSGGNPIWASAPVTSVYSRTGAVVAQSGDYTASQVTNAVSTASSYSDPAWITSLAGSKISGNIVGNAGTATALAANPADCGLNQFANAIAANGDLTCAQVAYSQISGTPSLAAVATSGSASDLTTGVLAAARGGAGSVTGVLKANGSGTVSAAVIGTDYVVPSGNVATATALAANPTDCSSGQYATTIAANGDLACAQVAYSQVSGTPSLAAVATSGSASDLTTGTLANGRTTATSANTASAIVARDASGNFSAGTITAGLSGNASTATALAANPADCTSGQFATTIAANGDLTCAAVSLANVSGAVGGASNLTTVGAVPYVSASGVLSQDATALFWDAANNRLGIGTATPGAPLEVVGQITSGTFTGSVAGSLVVTNAVNITAARLDTASNTGRFRLFNAAGGTETFLSTDGTLSYIKTGNVAIGTTTDDSSSKLQVAGNARFFTSTAAGQILLGGPGNTGDYRGILAQNTIGLSISSINDGSAWLPVFIPSGTSNFIVGGSTNANFKLDVATSASSGTARFYDQTATTGSTKVVVRAGAGQSSTKLQEWQNSSGTVLSFISSSGGLAAQAIDVYNQSALTTRGFSIYGDGTKGILAASSDALWQWYSGTNLSGTPDLSLSRASAGVLQVGDGAANANGTVRAAAFQVGGTDVAIARNAAGVLEVNSTTAGTFRDIRVRDLITTLTTPASSTAACAAGTWGADADYIYICTSTNNWKRVALTTF